MTNFNSFHGTITMIHDLITGQNGEGCYKVISAKNELGTVVNFVVSPTTYIVDHVMLAVGDRITGYYDANAPAPLIFPPQYQALVIVKDSPSQQTVKVSYFNSQLVSKDGELRLNISPYTQIVLTNGLSFSSNPANRNLIVIYGLSTQSIPAQTTPNKIIVMC